jgi:hypothetical protein
MDGIDILYSQFWVEAHIFDAFEYYKKPIITLGVECWFEPHVFD